ncbi:MAG: glutamyl-tRNA reductase [Chitinophagaceae bacterium]|nr:glutamyl-tRNA reductase [Chitinophagaceae bacterium]
MGIFVTIQKNTSKSPMHERITDIGKFYLAGINYKKTDASVRGQFAINNDQYQVILNKAPLYGINELFILSTCNRTEVYGLTDHPENLIDLLCTETTGDAEQFSQLAYTKTGITAVQHLFEVAAGLDSQILGDYEIIGQIKAAVKFAKEQGFIKTFSDRLINAVLQSSKQIKNETALSGGTVSVSFAAVQYLRENVRHIGGKNILLVGAGKIGRNTCKNLADYVDAKRITLINRTEEKAVALADELNLHSARLDELPQKIAVSDIIFIATNSVEPVILRSHLEGQGEKLIIDLSVPCNVEAAAQQLPGITLIDVDELSKLKDKTLTARKAEVPKAKAIIEKHIADFTEWYDMRKHVPVLKAVKTKLEQIHTCSLYTQSNPASYTFVPGKTDFKIQQVVSGMATKMRKQNQKGCYYIEAINEFIATATD